MLISNFMMNSQKGDEERLYLTELDMFCVHFGSRIFHYYETNFSDFRINKAWNLLKDKKNRQGYKNRQAFQREPGQAEASAHIGERCSGRAV